jgi:hypothetical protein
MSVRGGSVLPKARREVKTRKLKRGLALVSQTWGDEVLLRWLRRLFVDGGRIVLVVKGNVIHLHAEDDDDE